MINKTVELGTASIPLVITCVLSIAFLLFAHRILLGDKSLSTTAKFPRQLILLGVYIVAIISIVVSLPVANDTRNQILGLFGILLSGVIAFSSTSIVSNIMAALVFRITKPFRTGDFMRVGEHFGRVTESGIFDTELQTEQRELIAFSNSYLLNHPIQVVRSSGTIVSVALSLGYDVHHKTVEARLLEAAKMAGLEEPFVQITELGDFSVVYRVSGLLTEVKSLLSSKSKLHECLLDALHDADIEIVSPNFMNTRNVTEQTSFIAPSLKKKAKKSNQQKLPEDVVFDKAEAAQQEEEKAKSLRDELAAFESELKQANAEDKDVLKSKIEDLKAQLEAINNKTADKGTKE